SRPCWLAGRPRSWRSHWRISLPGWPGRSWPRVSAIRNPPRWRHDARLEGRTARNAEPVDPAIRTTHNVPSHHRMRAFDRDLIRGGHYGQRSREPRKQAEHMAATDQRTVKKTLANREPSTHGTKRTCNDPQSRGQLVAVHLST